MPAWRSIWLLLAIAATAAPCHAGSRRVDVGGYRLRLRCVGRGSPVVVLDAGAGDTLETWDWVVPGVGRFTKVCAYDRAGLGRSDAGPTPRSSDRIATELGALLAAAHVPPPYVLVGHSFGGLNVRLFASRRPADVAGLVLVDATPEGYPGREDERRTREEREKAATSRALAPQAFLDELAAMPESAAAVRRAPAPEVPVVILTAAHPGDPEPARALWAELQAEMARAFPNARRVAAERSDHYIQFDEPELVIQAIRDLVEAARVSTPSRDRP